MKNQVCPLMCMDVFLCREANLHVTQVTQYTTFLAQIHISFPNEITICKLYQLSYVQPQFYCTDWVKTFHIVMGEFQPKGSWETSICTSTLPHVLMVGSHEKVVVSHALGYIRILCIPPVSLLVVIVLVTSTPLWPSSVTTLTPIT